jgi:uncharacterized peroxidase-related enzyme
VAFIETIPEDRATGPAAEMYETDRERYGFLPNFTRAFSHRPAVYSAWRQLVSAVSGDMDPRRFELATIAAARRLRSSYCMLAHGSLLAREMMEPDAVRAVALDFRSAGLGPEEVAIMDFADKVAGDAASITSEDVERLRSFGLSDADITDVTLAAAVRCFFSKTLDALGAEPDAKYADLDPALRDTLTVGRGIAAQSGSHPA